MTTGRRGVGPLRAGAALVLGFVCAGASGCLYTDTINAPPQASLVVTLERPYFRGDEIVFNADKSRDPDGDGLFYEFDAEACTEQGAVCVPIDELAADRAQLRFTIPTDVDGKPAALVRATVVVTDGRGAFDLARTSWPVTDSAPELRLQANSDYEREDGTVPVSLPVEISAAVMDADDTEPGDVALEWSITDRPLASQTGAFTFDEVPGANTPTYRLVPDAVGVWEVTVVATDPAGEETMASISITVIGDQPPCIAATSPLASFEQLVDSTGGAETFAVLEVIDEFDPYPDGPNGSAEFRWLVKEPGSGTFVAAGGDTPSLTLDPSIYAPGDELELRVEVLDRVPEHEPNCPDGDATCSVSGNTCLQRMTWTVGIR